MRRLSVPAGAPSLLHVVLERTRDVRMQDQSDVRLVDTHAECACRGDHAQLAALKPLLHLRLLLGREARMEVFRGQIPMPRRNSATSFRSRSASRSRRLRPTGLTLDRPRGK